jgi:hypothetical protein
MWLEVKQEAFKLKRHCMGSLYQIRDVVDFTELTGGKHLTLAKVY